MGLGSAHASKSAGQRITETRGYARTGAGFAFVQTSAKDTAPTLADLAAGFEGTVRWWRTGDDVFVSVRELTRTSGTGIATAFTLPVEGIFEIKPAIRAGSTFSNDLWFTAAGEMRSGWINNVGHNGLFFYRAKQ